MLKSDFKVLGIWIARKPPGFGFILMGSHRLECKFYFLLKRLSNLQGCKRCLWGIEQLENRSLQVLLILSFCWFSSEETEELYTVHNDALPKVTLECRMQVEMATNDMKGSKPSSYIDSSRSRGSATRYNGTCSQILHVHMKPMNMFDVGWRRWLMFSLGRSRGSRRSRSRDREPRLPLFSLVKNWQDPIWNQIHKRRDRSRERGETGS